MSENVCCCNSTPDFGKYIFMESQVKKCTKKIYAERTELWF